MVAEGYTEETLQELEDTAFAEKEFKPKPFKARQQLERLHASKGMDGTIYPVKSARRLRHNAQIGHPGL